MSSIVESSGGGGGLDWTSLTSGEQLLISMMTIPLHYSLYTADSYQQVGVLLGESTASSNPLNITKLYNFSAIKSFAFNVQAIGGTDSRYNGMYIRARDTVNDSNTVVVRDSPSSHFPLPGAVWTSCFSSKCSFSGMSDRSAATLSLFMTFVRATQAWFAITSFTTTDNKVHTLANLNY